MLLPVVGVPRVQQHSNLAFSHRAQGSQLHSTDGRVLLHVMLPRFWREPNLAPCILCNGCVGQVVSLSVAMTNSKRNGAPYRHLLLYGPPGTGKTRAAKSLAAIIGASFKRIQFTSDLLPADIIGANIYSQTKSGFEFVAGPLFAEFVLADEINRAPPRTQSALLEAMEERQVTVENDTHKLNSNFFVIATQNPQDLDGTFPLPEAQMDRFIFQIKLTHATREVEQKIMSLDLDGTFTASESALSKTKLDIPTIHKEIQSVKVDESIISYVATILEKIRTHTMVYQGASVRAGIAILRTARAYALCKGRDFVIPDDIKRLAKLALRHRIKLSTEALMANKTPDDMLDSLIESIAIDTK